MWKWARPWTDDDRVGLQGHGGIIVGEQTGDNDLEINVMKGKQFDEHTYYVEYEAVWLIC